MWSIPHRVKTRYLNSYALETLEGLPLTDMYNARRLRAFTPHEGTKLALGELTRIEEVGEDEEEDEVDAGVVEV
jgi:hypothetical protein